MNKLIWVVAFALMVAVVIGGLVAPVCMAGQPTPCRDTEHPGEPPCNMESCKKMTGGSTCSHYCNKGKGCCSCKHDQCDPMRGPSNPDEGEPQ